jgi:hypothetical protein
VLPKSWPRCRRGQGNESPPVLSRSDGLSWYLAETVDSRSVLKEEAHHLATGIGPAWLGVRSGSAPPEPCVAGAVKDPLLQHWSPAFVRLNGAGVTYPARSLAAADSGPEIRCELRLRNDLIAVDGVHRRVAVTVEHDGRHRASGRAVPT